MADDFIDDPAQRLDDLLDREEPRLANLFRVAIKDLKDDVDLNVLADLLEQGRVGEALNLLQSAAERLGSQSNVVFVTSGQSTADFLTGAGVGHIAFDQVNIWAVQAMQVARLTLIREFTDEQRRATQQALLDGVERGLNPRDQARYFRDSIGLTERQWQAVETYRRSLERVGLSDQQAEAALQHAIRDKRGDAQILRAMREGRPLPAAKIEWLVQRKIEMSLKHRSEVIARTEALRSVHEGNEAMYRQAIEAGTINPEQLRRTWTTRLDGRERKTHELLNGQERRWGEVWQTRHGILRYPGDPEAPAVETIQCRCAIATRIRQR